MKPFLTLLTLTCLFVFVKGQGFISENKLSGFANAQPEFAPIGAVWYYSQYESYNPPQANYIKHTCIKDTTVEGKKVKVIQKTNFRYGGIPVGMGYEYLYQSGDTIFYWKSGEFHVLYNFSLSKGDSILLYSEMPNRCTDKTSYGWSRIDTVYTVQVNNQTLKTYLSTHVEGSVWGFDGWPVIEKIGSTQYLLPQNSFCGFMDGQPQIGQLRCYSDPELGDFYYEKVPCDTITSFPDSFSSLNRNSQLKVFPNPVSDKLFVQSHQRLKEGSTLEMYSVNGELIKRECLKGEVTSYQFNLSYLEPGIYILRMISDSGKYAEEIIIKE